MKKILEAKRASEQTVFMIRLSHEAETLVPSQMSSSQGRTSRVRQSRSWVIYRSVLADSWLLSVITEFMLLCRSVKLQQ